MRNRKKGVLSSEKGFTLFELIVVLAVIAILATIAYPVYTNVIVKAKITQAKAILNEIRVNAWSEYLETGNFPTSVQPSSKDGWTLSIVPAQGYDFAVQASKNGAPPIVTMMLKTDGTVKWDPQ